MFIQTGRGGRIEVPNSIQIVSLQDLGWNDLQVARALRGLDGGNVTPLLERLPQMVGSRGGERSAVWFAPFDPFVRLLPGLRGAGLKTIYLPVDDFESMSSLGFQEFSSEAESYLADQADLIVCNPVLANRMRSFGKPVRILHHPVAVDAFRNRPPGGVLSSAVLRGELTLGFWGHMNSAMFDADAVEFVAKMRPRWAINLLGEYDREPQFRSVHEQLKSLENIRFHGYVAPDVLSDYAAHFDVCLIPMPLNKFSEARDPIKLYQYLAAGKPVVATHMPGLAGVPYVENASTAQEFLDAIERAARTQVDMRVVDDFLARHSTDSVARHFVELVESTAARPTEGGQITAQAPATFAKRNPPLESYLSYLESDILSVRAWALDLESQARRKQDELDRIRHLLPIRLLRSLEGRKQ